MRIDGNKPGLLELRDAEERPEPNSLAREGVRSSLLAVDDARRGAAGAEDEVALQIGVPPERRRELGVGHAARAARRASRPSSSSRSESGEPSASEIIEPSS